MVLVQKVSKLYPLYRRPSDRILELLPLVGRRRHTDFWALREVSFQVERGETLGIVGPNGSGKSTLLEIVSGILQPTRGRVLAEGRIAALLELGAGFNPEFTGRENVFLNGEILGLGRREIEAVFPRIAAFAGIGEFIDRPVKEYSSGMYVRLAFSTAIHVEPDILIVDEALAVGDAIFANRCVQKFEELKRRQVTVLFVSHDLGLVKRLSDRALLMLGGRVEAQGAPKDVVNRYIGLVHEWQRAPVVGQDGAAGPEASFRHGDGASRILSVELLGQDGRPARSVESGAPVTVRVQARFESDVERPIAGILIRNRLGIDVFGTNTRIEGRDLGSFQRGETVEIDFRFDCRLTRQEYTLTAATQHWDGSSQDWLDDVLAFTVADPRDIAGLTDLNAQVVWRRE
ncbi:MAG: ABC transporter ATP-binding protein [Acidobacteria bacterium]|nr:ABC transporter ATP-binding protein [Acidobacteriota bacterium]